VRLPGVKCGDTACVAHGLCGAADDLSFPFVSITAPIYVVRPRSHRSMISVYGTSLVEVEKLGASTCTKSKREPRGATQREGVVFSEPIKVVFYSSRPVCPCVQPLCNALFCFRYYWLRFAIFCRHSTSLFQSMGWLDSNIISVAPVKAIYTFLDRCARTYGS
jgi:hypothetical protein